MHAASAAGRKLGVSTHHRMQFDAQTYKNACIHTTRTHTRIMSCACALSAKKPRTHRLLCAPVDLWKSMKHTVNTLLIVNALTPKNIPPIISNDRTLPCGKGRNMSRLGLAPLGSARLLFPRYLSGPRCRLLDSVETARPTAAKRHQLLRKNPPHNIISIFFQRRVISRHPIPSHPITQLSATLCHEIILRGQNSHNITVVQANQRNQRHRW